MKFLSKLGPRRKTAFISISILLVLTVAFIWWHSAQPGYESQEESTGILALIRPIIALLLGERFATDHFVRKLAHFTEFAVLGIELIALFAVLQKANLKSAILCAGTSATIAAIDETIQLFPIGRNAAVGDVLLDFSGSVFGILLFLGIYCIILKYKSKST